MEDYDCIEMAFVFDNPPSVETYETLLETLLGYSGIDTEATELNIKYQNEGDESEWASCNHREIARIARTSSSMNVSVPLEWDDISIGFSKGGMGFPTYSSTPYLRFTTWIHTLQEPDREPLERVTRRRWEFAEIHARAANVLDPKWGFGRRGGLAIGEDETVEALAAMTTPPLYEYNVFRPETVEAIGRDRVLSAPAWYVEELDSGGVFLAVREPPKQCNPSQKPCVEVADHLGISLARTERYH